MAFGTAGFLGISRQESFGTATSSWEYAPILSETLSTNIEQLIEEGVRNRYEEGPTQTGLLSVEGDISMEVHPHMIGHFLRGALGVSSFAAVVTSTVWDTYLIPAQTDFSTDCPLPPYTIQVYKDVGSSHQFTDAIINGLTIENTSPELVKATATVIARVSSLMDPTAASFPTGDAFAWSGTSLQIAGAANADIENFTLTIENNMEGIPTLNNTNRFNRYGRTGFRTFKLSGTLDFISQTEFNIFRAQTQQQFLINIANATSISSGYYDTLFMDLPQLRYTTFGGNISGASRVTADFDGDGKFDVTSSYAFRATLTNTKFNYQ
tara:strand:+ start:12900 stop:13868 length:969 start_codon:yes stop_codon:yes gene_type:complete